MKAPPAFYRFALNCQDPRETGYDFDDTVKVALKSLSPPQRVELADFLSKTLAATRSDGQLLDLWRQTSSGFVILEGARGFLGEVLKDLRAMGTG